MSLTGCQHSLGRREGGSPVPACPLLQGAADGAAEGNDTATALNWARGQSPAGAPQGALQMESSSQILPVQQLHIHKATKGLKETRMGEKSPELRGEKRPMAGEKVQMKRGSVRIQPMAGGARAEVPWNILLVWEIHSQQRKSGPAQPSRGSAC